MTILRTIPAVLSVLLMAAHFLRRGDSPVVFLCVALIPLLFVRRAPARFLSILLLAACGVGWLVIAWQFAEIRKAVGMPYTRMALILGGVALFTFFSAWLLPPATGRAPADTEGGPPGRGTSRAPQPRG